MFSIRNFWPAAIAGLLACGCTKMNVVHPSPLNRTPIVADGAMQARDFPQSSAHYASGAAVAGPTEFNYEPAANQPQLSYYFADYGTWALNMVLLPYYLIVTPQTNEVIYPGEVVPLTYTAQPPLAPQQTMAYAPKGIRPPVMPASAMAHPMTATTRAPATTMQRSTTWMAPTTRPASGTTRTK